MKTSIENYNLYSRFIEEYLPCGFKEIDRMSPSIMKLEEFTDTNKQFFFISDLIKLKTVFTSLRCLEMLGVSSKDFNPSVFLAAVHPDELIRHNAGKMILLNLGQELFIEKKGCKLISSNFRFKNGSAGYINTMVQCFLFFTNVPYPTVYLLEVLTDISWFRKFTFGYHYYLGDDIALFRYPDEKLLLTGDVFTPGELRSLN